MGCFQAMVEVLLPGQDMSLLFIVTHPASGAYLAGLGAACIRQQVDFMLFFTGDGVITLHRNQECLENILNHAEEAVACEFSWQQKMTDQVCPITQGSQTDHSRMLGLAEKVVSL